MAQRAAPFKDAIDLWPQLCRQIIIIVIACRFTWPVQLLFRANRRFASPASINIHFSGASTETKLLSIEWMWVSKWCGWKNDAIWSAILRALHRQRLSKREITGDFPHQIEQILWKMANETNEFAYGKWWWIRVSDAWRWTSHQTHFFSAGFGFRFGQQQ